MNLTRYLNVVITGVIIFLAAMTILLSPHELISQSRKLPSPLKLKDSLVWGRFESHPARNLVERAPILSETDYKMIALGLLGISFDAKKFSGKFPSYFKEYNAAENEFQRNKLVPSIKEKFQARQRELSAIEEFLVVDKNGYRSLGEYSFTNQAFSFFGIGSEFGNTHINVENEDDMNLFPRSISVDENNAERIIENNPSRKVVRYIIIKPTKGGSLRTWGGTATFLDGYRVVLEGIAVFAVVAMAETKEVLAAYPERSVPFLIERLEDDLSLSYVVESLGELGDKSAIPVLKKALSTHLLNGKSTPTRHLQALTNLTGEDWNALFHYDYKAVLSVMRSRNWVNVVNNWHIDSGIDNYEKIGQWFSKDCWEGHPCEYSIERINIVSLSVVELILQENVRLSVTDKQLKGLLEKGFKVRNHGRWSTRIEKYSGRLSVKLDMMHMGFRFLDISYIE